MAWLIGTSLDLNANSKVASALTVGHTALHVICLTLLESDPVGSATRPFRTIPYWI